MGSETERLLPQHIAIVMDGNGRWAKKRKMPVTLGHKAGVETVRGVLDASRERGVNNLTLFAFSSENWQRPSKEVSALMALFSTYLDKEVAKLNDEGVCLRFIGRRDRFSSGLIDRIEKAESLTKHNRNFNLSLAVDYGGKWDITEAARRLAEKVAEGVLVPEEVSEEALEKELCLSGLPSPDLLIRTSGEHRVSNFLLWQLAYAEFYFTDVLWPDFGRQDLFEALDSFASRDRRFGGRNPEKKHA